MVTELSSNVDNVSNNYKSLSNSLNEINTFSSPDLSTFVNIIGYTTTSNQYIAPKNGYVYLSSGYSSNSVSHIRIIITDKNGNSMDYEVNSHNDYSQNTLIPIAAGNKVYIYQKVSNSLARYYINLK